jgi:hypothetical protein
MTEHAEIGRNGGPPLDESTDLQRGPCKFWRAGMRLPKASNRPMRTFCLGLSRRRVKRPTGTCDRRASAS